MADRKSCSVEYMIHRRFHLKCKLDGIVKLIELYGRTEAPYWDNVHVEEFGHVIGYWEPNWSAHDIEHGIEAVNYARP